MLTGSMIEKFTQRIQDLSNKVKTEDNYLPQYNLLEEQNQNSQHQDQYLQQMDQGNNSNQKESSNQRDGQNVQNQNSFQQYSESQNKNFISKFTDRLKEPSKQKKAILQKIKDKIASIKPKSDDKKQQKQKKQKKIADEAHENPVKKRGRPPKQRNQGNQNKKPEKNNQNSGQNQQNNQQNSSKQRPLKEQNQRRQAIAEVLNQIKLLNSEEKNNYLRKKYKQFGLPSTHDLKILIDSYRMLFAIEKQVQQLTEKPNQKQTSRRFARQFLRYVQQNKTEKKYKFRKICSIVLKGLKLVNFRPDVWLNKFMIQNRTALQGVDLSEYSQKDTPINKYKPQPYEKVIKQKSEPKEKSKNKNEIQIQEEQNKQDKKSKKQKKQKKQSKKTKKVQKEDSNSEKESSKQKSESFNQVQQQDQSKGPKIGKKFKKLQEKKKQKQKLTTKQKAQQQNMKLIQQRKQIEKQKQKEKQRERQAQKQKQKQRQRQKQREKQREKERQAQKQKQKEKQLKQKQKQKQKQKNRQKQQLKQKEQFFEQQKQVKSTSKQRKNIVHKSLPHENKKQPEKQTNQTTKNQFHYNSTTYSNRQQATEVSKLYPESFRKKIAAKLDTAIFDTMQNLIKQKCQQFCVEEETLREINKQFGKYLLQRSLIDEVPNFTGLYQYGDQLQVEDNLQNSIQKQYNVPLPITNTQKLYNLAPLSQQYSNNIQVQNNHKKNSNQPTPYVPKIIINPQPKLQANKPPQNLTNLQNKKPHPHSTNGSVSPLHAPNIIQPNMQNKQKQKLQKKTRDIYKPPEEQKIQQSKFKIPMNPFQIIGSRLMNFIRFTPNCNQRMIKDEALKIVTTVPEIIGKVKQQGLARWLHTFIQRNRERLRGRSPTPTQNQPTINNNLTQKPKIMIKPPVSLSPSISPSIPTPSNYRPLSPIQTQSKPQYSLHNAMQNGPTNAGGLENGRNFHISVPRIPQRNDPKANYPQNGRI